MDRSSRRGYRRREKQLQAYRPHSRSQWKVAGKGLDFEIAQAATAVEVWSCDEDGHVIVPFPMGTDGACDMDALDLSNT